MSKPKFAANIEIPDFLIKELLTDSEIRMVKQRLLIIKLLKDGLSIRAVAERAKVGTDTVVRISKKLENSSTLRNALSSTKWVFGQVSSEEKH